MDKITTLHVLKCVKYPRSLSIRVTFDMLSYGERSANALVLGLLPVIPCAQGFSLT